MMPVADELIDRFLDGEVSGDEAAEVIEWLESRVNLQRFARRAELHADLRSSLGRRSIQASALEECDNNAIDPALSMSDHPDSVRLRPLRLTVGVGVVALVTAACLLIVFVMPREETLPVGSHGHHVTVVSEIDAVLTNGESNWDEAELVAGDYQLRRGLLHLRFGGGVMVYVEAPARFDVLSDKHIVLHRGRLSASVPPEGLGFTVDTPEAEIIDFGTEFSIDVESGTSEVHVFDGLVRVQPRSRNDGEAGKAVDLRTSQAVKIEGPTQTSVNIELATDRFIRNFEEPKRKFLRSLKQLSPVAFYRMAIRDKGLVSEPPQYAGQVLTGEGSRPPHARGVFAGGSLRVGAGSTGRGGRVNTPPPLGTGRFTLAAFVYLEARAPDVTVATNIRGGTGNFALSLDENRLPQVTVREMDGELRSVASNTPLSLTTWHHLVVTADGDQLRLYEDGQPVASAHCESMATSVNEPVWFGTDADGLGLWNGRIDELALFDKALSDKNIAELYQAALEEMARSE